MKKINMETANCYFMSNFKKSHSPINFNIHFIPFIYALYENNIAYTIEANSDGMMVRLPDGSDVALNSATYGCEKGLLEGYGKPFYQILPNGEIMDTVTGYLTYEEAITMYIEYYNK